MANPQRILLNYDAIALAPRHSSYSYTLGMLYNLAMMDMRDQMHIVLLCATNRGYRFADKLFSIGQSHRFTVFSFRETLWEPPYLDAIRQLTIERGHAFYETRNVGHAKWESFWADSAVDLLLMVSWRYLVPKTVYQRASKGAYVFHDSLLPKYRGFSPTVWAMINGERETGATLFEVADDVDAGDIVAQLPIAIDADDTIANVMENVTRAYLNIVENQFARLLNGSVEKTPQRHSDATYTCKWTPADGLIDWRKSSRQIYNLIRATSQPYTGAFTELRGRKLTIWSAELPAHPRTYVSSAPGRVVEKLPDGGAVVLTGDGCLILRNVQLGGEGIVNAADALDSLSLTLGGQAAC